MRKLIVRKSQLEGLSVIETSPFQDHRGVFARLFCAQELNELVRGIPIAQVNHSITRHKATIRGMHYQSNPFEEIKYVKCIAGAVWDVAVDMRPTSPTYLQWHAETLTAENGIAMLVPQNYAHGFQALTENAEIIYLSFAPYSAEHEMGVNPHDPKLAIKWPMETAEISEKDRTRPFLT